MRTEKKSVKSPDNLTQHCAEITITLVDIMDKAGVVDARGKFSDVEDIKRLLTVMEGHIKEMKVAVRHKAAMIRIQKERFMEVDENSDPIDNNFYE